MTAFILITGFLGAGKTTFLKEYIRLFPGKQVAVLVNEFGKEPVDGILLRGAETPLAEVTGGSIFCACRIEQFSAAITELLAHAPDVLAVETSGLADPSRIRALLTEHPLAARIAYKGCLCLADACRLEKALAGPVACGKQLAVSDVVVLNKTDAATPEQKERARALLREHRPDAPVLETSFGRIPEEWADALRAPRLLDSLPGIHTRDLSLQSRVLCLAPTVDKASLLDLLRFLAPAAYRIKGFARTPDGVYLAEAVGETVSLTLWEEEPASIGRLVVLSGNGLPLRAALAGAQTRWSDILQQTES